jgi:hypothetical protein
LGVRRNVKRVSGVFSIWPGGSGFLPSPGIGS